MFGLTKNHWQKGSYIFIQVQYKKNSSIVGNVNSALQGVSFKVVHWNNLKITNELK